MLVLSGFIDYEAPLKFAIMENHRRYAQLYGYDYKSYESKHSRSLHEAATWSKPLWILDGLEHYDWIFWVDADSIFMNTEINPIGSHIENSEVDIVFSNDKVWMNAGQLLVRSSTWSKKFLRKLLDLPERPCRPLRDNGAFWKLMFGKCLKITSI